MNIVSSRKGIGSMAIIGIIVVVVLVIGGVALLARQGQAPTEDEMIEMEDDATTEDTSPSEAGTIVRKDGKAVVSLTGKNFSFSLAEIRVKKGETVRIEFESAGGFHDWAVDEFDATTEQVNPGTKTSVEFVADKVGTFEYYCSVGSHREMGMVGKLIVE